MRLSRVLAIVLLSSGCGAGAIGTVRAHAAKDMACPEREVKVTAVASGTGTDSGDYDADGCKQLRRYYVSCNVFGLCSSPDGVDILSVVMRQAAFDLKCEQAAVMVQRLNPDTFGATGCDHQVSYALLCSGQGCRVVQNTQSQ